MILNAVSIRRVSIRLWGSLSKFCSRTSFASGLAGTKPYNTSTLVVLFPLSVKNHAASIFRRSCFCIGELKCVARYEMKRYGSYISNVSPTLVPSSKVNTRSCPGLQSFVGTVVEIPQCLHDEERGGKRQHLSGSRTPL